MQPRRTLIVGAGDVGQVVERKIRSHPEYGLDLVGFVDERPHAGTKAPLVGGPADLPQLVDRLEIDWVVLAFSQSSYEDTLDLLRAARRPDVHLSIVPRFFEVFASNATIQELEGMPVVNLPPMRLSRSVRVLKRAFDVDRRRPRAARRCRRCWPSRPSPSSSTAAGRSSSARSATGAAAASSGS